MVMKGYRTLRILLTNTCTLDCRYCCAEGHKPEYNNFNVQNIKNLVLVCNQFFKIDRIKLTGGEPLNFPEIFEIVKAIYNSKEENQEVSIVTNGTQYDEIVKLTKAFGNLDLTISLPSIDRRIFHEITSKGNLLANVVASIDKLITMNYPIKINCVLVDGVTNTIENISTMLKRYSKNHNVSIRFLELNVNSINRGNIEEVNYKSSFEIFENIVNEIGYRRLEEFDTRSSYLFSKDGIFLKYIKYFCHESSCNCPDDKSSIWVSCDGNLTCCPYNSQKNIKLNNFEYNEIFEKINENFRSF